MAPRLAQPKGWTTNCVWLICNSFTMATIAVLGTMDTKGEEHAFVAEQIRRRGHKPLIIDVGVLDIPTVHPDITRQEVAAAAGGELGSLGERRERGEAVTAMSQRAPMVV